MPSPKRTIVLTPEQHAFAAAKVASGEYATIAEVIGDGLRALQEQEADPDFERWLKEEVVPVATAMRADPTRGIPLRSAVAELEALHERTKAKRA